MKVALMIVEDRHTDIGVEVFADAEVAIQRARTLARELNRHGDLDEVMGADMVRDGWLYYGIYSCEGDCIRVEMKEVQS